MEKDDEVSGSGNINTAEFWQYDPRLGRRWNLDLIRKPWQSDYSCFSDNPVWKMDPDGDDDYFNKDGSFSHSTKTGSKIYVATDNGNLLYSKVRLDNVHNRVALGNVATYYAEKAGVVGKVAVGFDEGLAFTILKSKDAKENKVFVNAKKGISKELNDYNNLTNALTHEASHQKDINSDEDYNHLSGPYLDGIKDKSFDKTTQSFKDGIVGTVAKILQKAASSEIDGSGGLAQAEEFVSKFNDLSGKTGSKLSLTVTPGLQGEHSTVKVNIIDVPKNKK